jgi:hypothetical protein
MRRTFIHLLVSATALGAPAVARGADDLTPLAGPTLPMPAPVPGNPGTIPSASPISFYRPNRMDVWQNYAVDRSGRWRPRVALTGEGAFYIYNGKPYLRLPVDQLNVMPYLLD